MKKWVETGGRTSAKISLNQGDLENLVAKAIVSTMIPFRDVEDKWLKEIFNQLKIDVSGLFLPSRQSVVKTTSALFEKDNENLRNLLRETTYVWATADIWSGKKRSFMGVTVHWISNFYERQSAALACIRFKGSHTNERIADLLQDIFAEFGLNTNCRGRSDGQWK